MLAIWFLVPLPFLKPAWTSGSSWFMYCWSLAWRILSITLLTYLEVFTQKQHISFKMTQVPPCSGIRRSISCLFWSTAPAKLCLLFRTVLRNLIPRNLILVYSLEWHSSVVLNRYLRSPRGSQVYWVSSSVFSHGLTHEYLECCGGKKFYRVGALSWAGAEPLGTHLSRL